MSLDVGAILVSPFLDSIPGIMGRNLWRQLKHRYNVFELEAPEPPEEDAVSLKTHRKRKRGKEEVGGTSASHDVGEATSRVVDAVDLTDSPPAKEASPVATAEVVQGVGLTAPDAEGGVGVAEVEVCVSEQTVRVAKVAGSASGPEMQAGKAAEPEVQAGKAAEPEVQARNAADPEVQASGLAAQAAGAGSSQGPSRTQYLSHRFGKGIDTVRLDHVSASAGMDSLWSAGVTAERFFPQGSLSSEDQGLIDRIGPEDSFDAAQVMLQRVIGIMSHWKPKWGQQREDLAKQQQELAKREQELAKQEQELAKVKGRLQPWKEANKILRVDNKTLTAALDEAKRRVAELRTARSDLAPVQKSLEIALRSNDAYASRVRSLEDVVASLKGELVAAAEERLRSEAILGGREDEIAALRVELVELAAGKAAVEGRLVEMERSVVAEHTRGFQKATRQARLLAPGFDFSSMHLEKVVRRGRIVSEDDVNDSSSENASA
ncbi:uncharacterized protein LOC114916645 [Cajanus cajan]|uniref:uncharacterized protein LOC114916645 n=1 Tax=Cajanus cajan TaxID=3821 RepID=UPI0010FB681B|nr:uncharacterized protein LOC114916645 [Cajanus cajan]